MPNSSNVTSLIEHPDPAVQKIVWQNTTEFLQLALEKLKRGAPEPTPEFISRRQCYFLDGFMMLAMDNRKGCVFAKDIDQLLLKALFVANGCDKLRMTKDASALRYETEADRLQYEKNCDELRMAITGLTYWRPHINLDIYPLPIVPDKQIHSQILSIPARLTSALNNARAAGERLMSGQYDLIFSAIAEIISRDHRTLYFLAGVHDVYPVDEPPMGVPSHLGTYMRRNLTPPTITPRTLTPPCIIRLQVQTYLLHWQMNRWSSIASVTQSTPEFLSTGKPIPIAKTQRTLVSAKRCSSS